MAPPLSILVIDSNPAAELLYQALKSIGVAASVVFCDSVGASAHLAEFPADLVLLEIVMADSDGIELLKLIKQEHPATRVIATSGGGACLPRDTVLYWAGRLGADVVLPKPFDCAQLERALHDALSKGPASTAQDCHP